MEHNCLCYPIASLLHRFLQLVGVVPTDAVVLQRLGEMYDADGDKSQAFQYHYDVIRNILFISHLTCCISHSDTILRLYL